MENIRSRLRTRSAEPPALSPALSSAPPTPPAADKGKKRKRSASKPQQRQRRARSSTGQSIPCNTTTHSNSSAVSRSPGAQSLANATLSTTPDDVRPVPIIDTDLPATGSATGAPLVTSIPSTSETSNSFYSNLPNNSETLVINKDVLSEMISCEVSKRLSEQNVTLANSALSNSHIIREPDQGQPRRSNYTTNIQHPEPTSGALEQAVSNLLNETGEPNRGLLSNMKFDLPLDSTVSDKIKKQIIAREYIELGCLLSSDMENDMKLNVRVDDNGPAIVLNNVRKTKPIYNVNTWTSAMHIYGSIYLKAFPHEIGPFFQYLEFISKMAKKGFFWTQYDEAFRRARQHENISWGTILVNQYMSCFAASLSGNAFRQGGNESRQPFDNGFRKKQRKDFQIPRSYCYTLHREGDCKKPNCKWEHSCFLCKGPHSVLRCPQGNVSNTSTNRK